jgi:UDP-glucose 4-epimerase
MSKCIITGGSGFIGSHIVEALCQRGDEVVVYDNLHSGYLENIQPFITEHDVEMIHGDIMDRDHMVEVFDGATSVFHLGALISVPESMAKPVEYVTINAIGSLNVLEACRLAKVKNVVLSSSAAIYGDNPVVPKIESMTPEPKSPYAITKLDGEYYFQMYRAQHGINAVALRYFNVFGPRQDPKSQYAAAVPIFIDKALKNEDITIFGDGEQTRDFIYVKDIAQANLLAAEKGGDVFNVAWGQRITINDLAKTIIKLTGSSSKIHHLPERAGDIKHSMADNQKMVKQLGFAATSTLESGLRDTIAYFRTVGVNR